MPYDTSVHKRHQECDGSYCKLRLQCGRPSMRPTKPLPFSSHFPNVDEYINSLLSFATSSETFQNLCGGVHILEFLTQEPDLYVSLIPDEWRMFFDSHDVSEILELLMKVDLDSIATPEPPPSRGPGLFRWRGACAPPLSLLEYIKDIRQHSLDRGVKLSFKRPQQHRNQSWPGLWLLA